MAKKFDIILSECIDRGIGTLGKSVATMIYFRFERDYGLKRKDIPQNMELFTKALRSIFGDGAQVLERLIIEQLAKSTGIPISTKKALLTTVKETIANYAKMEHKLG